MAAFPIPEGVTASFSQVRPGNTATFGLDAGLAIVTFQPADINNPGTLTLYDNTTGNTMGTLTAAGYMPFQVPPGGGTYYFNATLPVQLVAATTPNSLR